MVKEQIVKKIAAYDTIIIHRHVRPDPDALGSQVGLKKMIEGSFPNKAVYAVGEEDPSLTYLARMDDIPDATYEGALVIVCDTANTGRIDDGRYRLGKEWIKIDHHPEVDEYGDYSWVDPTASSTSEMIYDLYVANQAVLKMDESVARLLYAGMVGDTGRFLFPSTTTKTFRYAAQLVEYPFDRQALYDRMYETDERIARLRGYMLENVTISPAGVSAVKLTKELLEKYQVTALETSKLVGTFGDIKGIRSWVIFVEEDEVIRARLRSKGPVINELAAKYRGGGHPLASGAIVSSWEEADQLIQDLEALTEKE